MAKVESQLEDTFADMPVTFFELLEQALVGLKAEAEPSKSLKKLLQEAWKTWDESNLSRHIRFVSECNEMNRRSLRQSARKAKIHEDGQIAAGMAT
jgi:UV DNA damage repair endonuclease